MFDQETLPDVIRQILDSREPRVIKDAPPHYRHAGVLIPLLVEEGMYKVLFTKRTDKVEHHKGQLSFPGGAVDDQDRSIEETALRESHEEIGLGRGDVEILGRIDDVLTTQSNFIVHPFVGLIFGPYNFEINEFEVKRLIKVPWDTIVANSLENRIYTIKSEGKTYQTPAFKHNGDLIWGATAYMLENFIEILTHK